MERRNRLLFVLKGIKNPFVYRTSREDWDRVSDHFEQYSEPSHSTFVSFIELEGGQVVRVNPKFVLLHQALFDTGIYQDVPKTVPESPEGENVDEEFDRVTFYVDGLVKPFHSDYMEEDDIKDLNFKLEWCVPPEYEFVSFTDCDGEMVSIRAEQIMLTVTPNYELELEEAEPTESGEPAISLVRDHKAREHKPTPRPRRRVKAPHASGA